MRFASSCSVSASVFFCQANLASAAALAMLTQYWRAALVWSGGGSAGLGARGDGRRGVDGHRLRLLRGQLHGAQ